MPIFSINCILLWFCCNLSCLLIGWCWCCCSYLTKNLFAWHCIFCWYRWWLIGENYETFARLLSILIFTVPRSLNWLRFEINLMIIPLSRLLIEYALEHPKNGLGSGQKYRTLKCSYCKVMWWKGHRIFWIYRLGVWISGKLRFKMKIWWTIFCYFFIYLKLFPRLTMSQHFKKCLTMSQSVLKCLNNGSKRLFMSQMLKILRIFLIHGP